MHYSAKTQSIQQYYGVFLQKSYQNRYSTQVERITDGKIITTDGDHALITLEAIKTFSSLKDYACNKKQERRPFNVFYRQ